MLEMKEPEENGQRRMTGCGRGQSRMSVKFVESVEVQE